jgi:hypothetical protein
MQKYIFIILTILVLVSLIILYLPHTQAATHDVSLSTNVTEYIEIEITQGDVVNFGNLTPGSPICYSTGTIVRVTTSAANGYTLGVFDNVPGNNSCLLHTDTTTRIPDLTNGTIETPVLWGSNYGLGLGLYAADTDKESKWGTGTTVCDSNNKYAAIPQSETTAHTAPGYHASPDYSSWSFKIDVQNSQKTGSYSGTMTFSAVPQLS